MTHKRQKKSPVVPDCRTWRDRSGPPLVPADTVATCQSQERSANFPESSTRDSRVLSLPIEHNTWRLHASGVEFLLVFFKALALERFNNLLHSLSDDTHESCLLRISIKTEYHSVPAVLQQQYSGQKLADGLFINTTSPGFSMLSRLRAARRRTLLAHTLLESRASRSIVKATWRSPCDERHLARRRFHNTEELGHFHRACQVPCGSTLPHLPTRHAAWVKFQR